MKQVKIIGLKVNQQFGILKAFECKFDQNNRIIATKGAVAAGKSTMQKAVKLGTQGPKTLRDDKTLYGDVDQEVQLLDGDTKIFIGTKSKEDGSLEYTIYTKDENGKIIKRPVVDGVELTPSGYLNNLQTALTWRMNELTSENFTTQKNILLELYKFELANLGVIFDKSSTDYGESVLGRLDKAVQARTEADVMRKQVGGFANHLFDKGYDVTKPETLPARIDMDKNLKKEQELLFKISNTEKESENKKADALRDILAKRSEVYTKLKDFSIETKEFNAKETVKVSQHSLIIDGITEKMDQIYANIEYLVQKEVYTKDMKEAFEDMLKSSATLPEPPEMAIRGNINFDGDKFNVEGEVPEHITELLNEYARLTSQYNQAQFADYTVDKTAMESELEILRRQIAEDKEVNKIRESCDAFFTWQDKNDYVQEIRKEYARLLEQVNTGVEGLKICFDEKEEKMNIYLAYNGVYDPVYFNNQGLEYRKLSSYSGTQKPMICLLVQNYLLSKLDKSLRYIWIDDVPIDLKTRNLIENMAEKLDLTVMINITGDFDKEHLDKGDILIEGGEVFFN